MDTKIKASFWRDPAVSGLEEDSGARLALLWLMTAQVAPCGWVEFSARQFRFDTGLETEALARACQALGEGVVSHPKGYWLRNFVRHQIGTGSRLASNNMARPIVKSLQAAPHEIVSEFFNQYQELLPLLHLLPSTPQALAKGLGSTGEGEGEGEGIRERGIDESAERRKVLPSADPAPAHDERITWSALHGFQGIIGEDLAKWREAYPSIDVQLAIQQAKLWAEANPPKMRNRSVLRFLNNWLANKQQEAGNPPPPTSTGSQGGAKPAAQKKEGAAVGLPGFPWRAVARDCLGFIPDPVVPWASLPPSQRREVRTAWRNLGAETQRALSALAVEADYQ